MLREGDRVIYIKTKSLPSYYAGQVDTLIGRTGTIRVFAGTFDGTTAFRVNWDDVDVQVFNDVEICDIELQKICESSIDDKAWESLLGGEYYDV